MIGWWIVVAAQTPEERDDPAADRRAAILATWEIGLGGLDWLHTLVDAGKAEQSSFSGYPNRYTAKAGEVLPLLADGPPPHRDMAVIGDLKLQIAGFDSGICCVTGTQRTSRACFSGGGISSQWRR